ncbi:MAG: hypothetical protein AMXMBFR7_05430 [Planctomycetota bacterium]
MPNKTMSLLPQFLIALLIGSAAYGAVTYTLFHEWRKVSLVDNAYDRAKDRETQEQINQSLDEIFLAPGKEEIKAYYTPLADSKKDEYVKIRNSQNTKELDAFFDSNIRPSTQIPWICALGLIAMIFILHRAFRPLFQKQAWRMALVMIMTGGLGGYFWFLSSNGIYPMGIDLAGGTELIYRLDTSETDRRIAKEQERVASLRGKVETGEAKADDLRHTEDLITALTQSKDTAPEKAADIVRKRIDPTGTKGIPITKYGSDRLRIQLPKASPEDVEKIKRAIRTQGRLTFHLVANPSKQQAIIQAVEASEDKEADGYKQIFEVRKDAYDKKKVERIPVIVEALPMLEGSRIAHSGISRNEQGGFQVDIQFDAQGATDFGQVTQANVGEQMAIVLDGNCFSAPRINEPITGGRCQITGNFSQEEASELSNVLNAGSLPAEVVLESEFTVGPSLGHEQIDSGILATLVGAFFVAFFIWIYYRVSGFIAVVCLGLNLIILLGALGFFKATMTLPGIAGILLTLGMAVDANVLIFERIREELARGRPVRLAVQHGFDRAVVTILDSQLTTLLSGIILYYLGTGPVRGFAVTLSLGILVTILANLWICRQVFDWLVSRDAIESLPMMQMMKNPNLDYMGMSKPWIVGSMSLVGLSLAGFVMMGVVSNKIYDLDFTGGTLIQFNFAQGQEQDRASVEKTVEETLRETVRADLDAAKGKLEALAASGKKGHDLREALVKELPVLGTTQFSLSSEITPEGLLEVAGGIGEVLKDWDAVRLDAQPFGTPKEGTNTYKSFTLTTRVTQAAVIEVLGERLLEAFKGPLEPRAVEVVEHKAIRIRLDRFDKDSEQNASDEQLKAEVEKAVAAVAQEPENQEVKKTLQALKAGAAVADEAVGRTRAYVELTPVPEDALELQRVLGALRSASIKHRVEGAIGRKTQYGGQVSGEMRRDAFVALLAALAGIFMYLWFRFEFSGAWGFGASLALFHDAAVTIGAVCLVNATGILPVLLDLNMVAAILTIIGYSVNDTIVIFDRIREIKSQHPTRDMGEIINEATNQTLTRTLITAGTTMLATLSLFILGGPTIRDLSFPFIVGIFVGCYSSIFVAAPATKWWLERFGSGSMAAVRASAPAKTATADNAHV